jgi:single-stranded-DNA-specific exonuclease
LDKCKDLLESYGGHAAAAGMTIDPAKIDAFRERFNEAVGAQVSDDDLVPRVAADARVTLGDLTPKFVNIVKQMEPFGPENMRPVLLCDRLRHRYEPRIVGNGHLQMTLTDGRAAMDAIAFGFGPRLAELKGRTDLQVAFSVDENEWNGKTSLQMKIKGVAA